MVLSDPGITRAGTLALRLLSMAQHQGYQLDTAFFYHNGAYAAVNPRAAAQRASWTQLSRASGLMCIVCQTALARIGASSTTLPQAWRLGGLGDWLAACERSDRVLQFGSFR